MRISTKSFDANLRRLRRNTRHLDLKRQITHIFGSLILSLVLVMLAHTTEPDFKYIDVPRDWLFYVSVFSLILSGSLFAYALYRIWTLICIVVDHNSEQDSNNTKESKVGSEPTQ